MRIHDIGASPIFAATSKVAERLVAIWNAFATRWNPIGVIAVTCGVLTAPLVIWRGFHSDEGVALAVARSAVEDGYWITPHLYNTRFVERPTLLSWIIAAVSAPFGSVNQFTARIPIILFLLAGCLLIYSVLRRVSASVPAALLGVALFLACPIVIRGYVMPTADMPLAVLLFVAFVVWWNGYERRPDQSCALGRDRRRLSTCRIDEGAAAGQLFRVGNWLVHSYHARLETNSGICPCRDHLRHPDGCLVRLCVFAGRRSSVGGLHAPGAGRAPG